MATLAEQIDAQLEAFAVVVGNDVQGILNDIGVLGDLDTTDKSNLVNAINEIVGNMSGGSAILTQDLISNVNEGGIQIGDEFVTSTALEAVIRAHLIKTSIANLTLNGGYASVKEVGTSIVNPLFSWIVGGAPSNLKLNDTDSVITNQTVIGNNWQSAVTYLYNAYKSVTWTVSGDNVDSITNNTKWVFPSYTGVKSSGATPDGTEILTGTKSVVLTSNSFTSSLQTTSGEYLWIAIAEDTGQSAIFTHWKITDLNQGDIDATSIVEDKGLVNVSGKNYRVYMFTESSELLTPITLS